METSLVLTIIGSVLILVGVIFNAIPKVENQKPMGDLAEGAVNPAAAFRISVPLQNVRRSFGLPVFFRKVILYLRVENILALIAQFFIDF